MVQNTKARSAVVSQYSKKIFTNVAKKIKSRKLFSDDSFYLTFYTVLLEHICFQDQKNTELVHRLSRLPALPHGHIEGGAAPVLQGVETAQVMRHEGRN
jgi:hypothetical protein